MRLDSQWESVGDLRIWIEVGVTRGPVSEPLTVALHIAREETEARKTASLLAGRCIFTFVSMDAQSGVSVFSSVQSFSGAGGVDYSGKTPLVYEVQSPSVPGRYRLHATVQSTPEDVRAFLVLAKMHAGAGPWWRGNQSTRPVLVELEQPDPGR